MTSRYIACIYCIICINYCQSTYFIGNFYDFVFYPLFLVDSFEIPKLVCQIQAKLCLNISEIFLIQFLYWIFCTDYYCIVDFEDEIKSYYYLQEESSWINIIGLLLNYFLHYFQLLGINTASERRKGIAPGPLDLRARKNEKQRA